MKRVILEGINFDKMTARQLVKRIVQYKEVFEDEDDIFLDGDTKAIAVDICEGNWR